MSLSDTALLDPASPDWEDVPASGLALKPSPITAQPSLYIQEKWKESAYGSAREVTVRAAHNGERVYFHLSWADETNDENIRNTDQFADAAAILFPVNGDAPLLSMGSPQAPVNAWYWRPDIEEPFSITAQGTGTTRRNQDPELSASGLRDGGEWSVVIRRRLGSNEADYVNLGPGTTAKVAVAIWQGSNQERGGLKAASAEWEQMEIEA